MARVYNNIRVTATVGGQKYHFRSKLEYNWAQYLDFLQSAEEIIDWSYETELFIFHGVTRAPVQYRPDFRVVENDGTAVFQECKGYHDGQTNSKLRLMAKHYPDVVMELVRQNIPKSGGKGANRLFNAKRYVRRIIDASAIFKQLKGYINFDVPKLREL